VRDGKEKEVSLKMLVPGDIIRLAAGDMVPADVRVLSAKDLFLNQVALTGEALSWRRNLPIVGDIQNPLDLPNICFMGPACKVDPRPLLSSTPGTRPTLVLWRPASSGSASSLILTRREQVYLADDRFHRSHGAGCLPYSTDSSSTNWLEAFLFAIAVAVG